MATSSSVSKPFFELPVSERMWIVRALKLQRASTARSMNKEVPGSALRQFFADQVSELDSMISSYDGA